MNRHERRAAIVAARKRAAAEVICAEQGHTAPDVWTMRPAWVGAGIVIPKVHFDRRCTRCGGFESVWADVEGATAGQPEALVLPAWLLANGATVTPPPGEIRNPPVAELEAIAARVTQA